MRRPIGRPGIISPSARCERMSFRATFDPITSLFLFPTAEWALPSLNFSRRPYFLLFRFRLPEQRKRARNHLVHISAIQVLRFRIEGTRVDRKLPVFASRTIRQLKGDRFGVRVEA